MADEASWRVFGWSGSAQTGTDFLPFFARL